MCKQANKCTPVSLQTAVTKKVHKLGLWVKIFNTNGHLFGKDFGSKNTIVIKDSR
jgi:hypothetical protein